MPETVSSLQRERFERSCRPWMPDLRRLANRLTGSPDDADDLLQELWLHLESRMEGVARLERPRPWLARVLYRLFVERWRRARNKPVTDTGTAPDDSVTPDPLPEEVFERGLERARLQAALDRLPAFQRELVLMHDVEGYKLTEIAEITQAPVGALKSRLHRARLAVRADLLRH